MAELKIIQQNDELTHVAISGSLDAAGVKKVQMNLTIQAITRKKSLILDVSGLTFVSSVGLSMLLACMKSLKKSNAKMILLDPPTHFDNVLKTTALDQVFLIANTLTRAQEIINA